MQAFLHNLSYKKKRNKNMPLIKKKKGEKTELKLRLCALNDLSITFLRFGNTGFRWSIEK